MVILLAMNLMSAKKVLTLKVESQVLDGYTDLANPLKMNRSEMIRTAVNEFAQKQNPRAA
jgi:metal-responsive CopG/Arc/MetJ family transcriptional regulator